MNLCSDIEQLTLADVIQGDIRNGYSPNSTESETGYWVLGLGALTDAGLNPTEIKPVELNEKVQSALLEPGDFLISRSNTPDKVGRSLRFKGEIKNCSYPDLMMRFRPNTNLIDASFLEYQLQSAGVRAYLKSCAAGSSASMVKITKSTVANTPIQLPPRAEQTKIAQILSTWDKAIATTERLLANSQRQKQALMQQLLTGQKRFAGFTDEWITVEFDELLGIEIGGTPSRSNPAYWDTEKTTNNRWLSIADLKGNLITDTSEYISDLGAAKSNTKLIPAGTIVMSFKLTIGRRAILAADTYTNEAICAFKIKDPKRLSNDFLFHALCLVNFEKDIDQAVKGKTLNKAKLKQLTLSLPSLFEQQKIAQVLSTADAAISNLQAQLAKLKLEKKALMQQLLTGQRRVKLDAEVAV